MKDARLPWTDESSPRAEPPVSSSYFSALPSSGNALATDEPAAETHHRSPLLIKLDLDAAVIARPPLLGLVQGAHPKARHEFM